VEPDKPDNPLHIRALRVDGIVLETEAIPDFLKELGLLTWGGLRHTVSSHDALRVLTIPIGQNCPKTWVISYYQGKIPR
jgi:hypothetical protein